jgi:hypothetical protein
MSPMIARDTLLTTTARRGYRHPRRVRSRTLARAPATKRQIHRLRCAVERSIVQRIVVFRFGRRSRDDTPGKHKPGSPAQAAFVPAMTVSLPPR